MKLETTRRPSNHSRYWPLEASLHRCWSTPRRCMSYRTVGGLIVTGLLKSWKLRTIWSVMATMP
ncbi:MAG: hypothetical protein E6I74_06600 [Chloroflexi bacterium]|nr:MAG: hypothetical protein E6I74_06600 [Chloroflexota bacterium]